jgi:hypothetical protein
VPAHRKRPGSPVRTLLLGIAADPEQATQAIADGADLIDASAATYQAHAAIRASAAGRALWTGTPADPVDADRLADTQATAVAVAAISTWLGAPVIRTRHTRAVRRAIDMTASIAGTRVPARTIRGLA